MKAEVARDGSAKKYTNNRDGRRSKRSKLKKKKVVWQEGSTIPGWNKVVNGQCTASSQTHHQTSKSLIAISRIIIIELMVACLDSVQFA